MFAIYYDLTQAHEQERKLSQQTQRMRELANQSEEVARFVGQTATVLGGLVRQAAGDAQRQNRLAVDTGFGHGERGQQRSGSGPEGRLLLP